MGDLPDSDEEESWEEILDDLSLKEGAAGGVVSPEHAAARKSKATAVKEAEQEGEVEAVAAVKAGKKSKKKAGKKKKAGGRR